MESVLDPALVDSQNRYSNLFRSKLGNHKISSTKITIFKANDIQINPRTD